MVVPYFRCPLPALLFALFLGALLGLPGAAAQNLSFESHTVESETDNWIAFAHADLTGDGLPDLAVQNGGRAGPLMWYEATDGGRSWTRHVIADTGPNGTAFATGDLELADGDGDGDVDVLAFEHPGPWVEVDGSNAGALPTTVYWYENGGEGQSWTPRELGTMPDYVKDVELEDYDGDGAVDVSMITNNDDHAFGVFRQKADGSFTRVQLSSLPEVHEGMDSGDLDGDEDPDIAVNGWWLENPGGDLTGVWTARPIDSRWFTQTGGWRHNATKTIVADLDGDGAQEVLMSHSESSGYPIVWYDAENPEQPEGWTSHVIVRGLNAVHTLTVADFDGDGTLDVLAGENGDSHTDQIHDDGAKQVRIFLNGGNAESWTPFVFSEEGLYNGRVADINGDGQPDIAGPTGHEGEPYRVYLNQ